MKIKDVVKRTIASNIKRARIAANMTQAEAASKLGITAQAISNYERGINGIENSLLLRMCEIYNTSMSTVLGEENESFLAGDADHIGATPDYPACKGEIKNVPANSRRSVTDDDIKFALFGGDGEITDEMYEEVKQFAAFVKNRGRKD